MNSGVDSNKDVYPILVDSSGKQYVIIDGNVTVIQATAALLKATVTQAAKDRTVTDLKPDGTNTMPAMDAVARPGFQKITDGSEVAIIETDDDDIAKDQDTLLVINLNYVYDAANDKWVRSTPSAAAPSLVLDLLQADSYKVKVGTWVVDAYDSNYWTGFNLNTTTHAQNDEIYIGAFSVPIAANYTFYMIAMKTSSCGKVHIIINGVDEGNIDCYKATPTVYNDALSVSLGELSAGMKVVSLKIATKNASATDYRTRIQAAAITKD